MTSRSDVSVVVLTLGEPTTERAIASARRQTLPPRELVVVDGLSPFSRALNVAAARVTTPFFLQLDADMVLDEDCVEQLRAHMAPGVGVAIGPLRDPLIGPVAGIKLFRRACFDALLVPNTIAPDTDFIGGLGRSGWGTPHVLKQSAATHTFGEHRPEYTPAYLYATYVLLGARYRYQRTGIPLMWRLSRLRRSDHPLATLALVAIGHGVFLPREDDVRKPDVPQRGLEVLEAFLATEAELPGAEDEVRACLALAPAEALARAYGLGTALRTAGAAPALRRCIAAFDTTATRRTWPAEVGLYHGVVSDGPLPAADIGLAARLW